MPKAESYPGPNHKYLEEAEALLLVLHQNFYENWLPAEMVINYGEAVKELVAELEKERRC
ncbi:MAG: hypothetical protein CO103_04740 [Chloroflexi bacterium CG_4_9_14_3_um_filter_45_9]|nr:MAG: hypothetical protein CO103_04740 [Chloroflexi bacterium CG_4_9_14_3_um_filter_45_9]